MRYKITIEDRSGNEVSRNYEWEIDSDFEKKGKAVEDMMDTLKNAEYNEAWSAVEPEHQNVASYEELVECPECGEKKQPEPRLQSGMKCSQCAYGNEPM